MCLAQDDRYEAPKGNYKVRHRILPYATIDGDRIRLVADHLRFLQEKGLIMVGTTHMSCTSLHRDIIINDRDMNTILFLPRVLDMRQTSETRPDQQRTVLCGTRLRNISTTLTVRIDESN